MYDTERAVIIDIQSDYALVKDFLHWLMDNNVPQFRGGMSGRGSFVGYFPIDQEEMIKEFLSNYDPDFGLDDDF